MLFASETWGGYGTAKSWGTTDAHYAGPKIMLHELPSTRVLASSEFTAYSNMHGNDIFVYPGVKEAQRRVYDNKDLHVVMDRVCKLCQDMYSHLKSNTRSQCR